MRPGRAGRPLAIDLYSGLGGWSEGLLAAGFDVVGFDIERHIYETPGRMNGERIERVIQQYPAQLVIQDVLTIDGARFKDASLIVASPPCTEFSYMAMPWTRAKQIARALRGEGDFPTGYKGSRTVAELTALFDACFRIQREAIAAAGHHIPMVVENVRGAQPWVGKARWNFGSFYIWGDVPALMPIVRCATKLGDGQSPGKRFDERPSGNVAAHREHTKVPGFRFDGSGKPFQTAATKSSKSTARKAASAQIAKIPFRLAHFLAEYYKPEERVA